MLLLSQVWALLVNPLQAMPAGKCCKKPLTNAVVKKGNFRLSGIVPLLAALRGCGHEQYQPVTHPRFCATFRQVFG